MKLLIVGEGRSDVGDIDQPEGTAYATGVLPILVRRILGNPESLQIQKQTFARIHKATSFRRKAALAVRQAHREGFDGVVMVRDRDRKPGSKRLEELREGVEKANVPLPSALGLAIECLEAWLLADESAIALVLDIKNPPRGPDPESLNGKRGQTNHPKTRLNKLMSNAPKPEDQIKMLERISELLSIKVLQRRCSKGFAPFANQVRRAFEK